MASSTAEVLDGARRLGGFVSGSTARPYRDSVEDGH